MDKKIAKILVIVGTVRQGRQGRAVADWYLTEARALAPHFDWEILDAAEESLPLFAESAPPLYGQYSPRQQALAAKIRAARGFVFVSGEYNKSLPASLKNLLDYIYAEWNRKAAAVVSYGGSGGGLRAAEHLLPVLNNLGVAVIRNQISIHKVWEALSVNQVPKPDHLEGDVAQQLAELQWWVAALASGTRHRSVDN